MKTGSFTPVAFCPKATPRLRLRRPRGGRPVGAAREQDLRRPAAAGPARQEKVEPRCGLLVIDTKTGDVVHWLRIQGIVTELYDAIALPGIKRPSMIGFRQQEIRRTVSVET